jgi:hypothetical protein
MDLRNDHNVYILGAGFSKDAGLPLIGDFLVKMRDSHEWLVAQRRQRQADAVQKVLEFRLGAASAAYYVPLDLENIEELFSLASASAGDMDARTIRMAIAATIDFIRKTKPSPRWRIFAVSSTSPGSLFVAPTSKGGPAKYPEWTKPAGELDYQNPGRCGPLSISAYGFHVARLLGMFLDGKPQGENTFITFNYDTVLEDALIELKVNYDYKFGRGARGPIASQSPIPLFKLHGSVNWGRKIKAGIRQPLRILQPLKIYSELGQLLNNGAVPFLVPPTWKKTLGGPLEGVWDGAIHKLSTATRIIIIGFSMPPTDMHFRYLMAAGLKNNVSLRQVLFVNPAQDKARAETLLRKSYVAFSEKYLYNFTSFQEGGLDSIGRPAESGLRFDIFPE